MITIICKNCNTEFKVSPNRKLTAKFCSLSCNAKYNWTGRKHSLKTITKQRTIDIWNNVDEVVRLYNSGLTTRQLGEKYNCNCCSVSRMLKINGIKLRKPHKKKGTLPWNKGKPYLQIRGEKNPNWKGGITNLNQQIRHCIEYKNWIRLIFERDDYTCKLCNQRGGNLEVDHYPKRFSNIIKDDNIKSYQDAQKCLELWALTNGRTLCLKCHNRTKQVKSRFKKVWSNNK